MRSSLGSRYIDFMLRLAFSPEIMPLGQSSPLSNLRGSCVSDGQSSSRIDRLTEAGMLSHVIRDHFSPADRDFLQAYFTIVTDCYRYQIKALAASRVATDMHAMRRIDYQDYEQIVLRWFGFKEARTATNRMTQWRCGRELAHRRDEILRTLDNVIGAAG